MAMRQRRLRGGFIALALVTAGLVFAQDDHAARVSKAREAARANAESREGREWLKNSLFATDRLMILVLNRCLPEDPADEVPTPFAVFLRLSRAGRSQEIVTELDEALGKCMTDAARELPFPEPPRDDYWVQLNMAAPL